MQLITFTLIIAGIGAILAIPCGCVLIVNHVWWSHKYCASILQRVVVIPEAGRYSISIKRKRGWPKTNFSITETDTGEKVPYTSALSFITKRGGKTVTRRVGYFDVKTPGKYEISSEPDSHFHKGDEIIIKKYMSDGKTILLIVGLAVGWFMLFMGGMAFAGAIGR